jgi:tetratricopeptide (TPR) repeat protein
VIHSKNKDWREVIRYADEALLAEPCLVKALYHKGRALLELTEYQQAIEVLSKAVECDPSNVDVKRELARAETALKAYQDRQTKMFQKMFTS